MGHYFKQRTKSMNTLLTILIFAAVILIASAAESNTDVANTSFAPDSRCFELRTYTAAPGKLDALNARFRDHTCALFRKHGMEIVGFWMPTDKESGAGN